MPILLDQVVAQPPGSGANGRFTRDPSDAIFDPPIAPTKFQPPFDFPLEPQRTQIRNKVPSLRVRLSKVVEIQVFVLTFPRDDTRFEGNSFFAGRR